MSVCAPNQLVFTDRVIATLVILRFQLPHAALAVFYGVDRSTVTRAVHEIRPLLAARGFAVPGEAGLRLHTLADVFAYATAKGVEPRLDSTEVRVRRPKAGRPGRRTFVSGKMRQNTKNATVITDGQGRTLWTGAVRPGRMPDQTAVKTEGIEALFEQYPQVKAKVDTGYRGPVKRFPGQVQAPPKSPPMTRRARRSPPGRRPARSNPRSGSVSSTPTPSTSSGGPSSGTSAAASTTPRPIWPSLTSSPTAPQSGNHPPANPPQPQSRTTPLVFAGRPVDQINAQVIVIACLYLTG
ncbi:transposase family protein [Streptomyces sp. NPDC088141]|uniref:transposase family protein n=1 Tax=Streptomyces sp. NPDC088141 TaxID=3155179 RepID=UPI00343D98A2